MIWEDEDGLRLGETPRRLFALIKGLPADAVLWRLHGAELQPARAKYPDANVVSISEFVARHQTKVA